MDVDGIPVPKTDPDRVKWIHSDPDSHLCSVYVQYVQFSTVGGGGGGLYLPSLPFCEGKQGTFPLLCAVGVF